MQWRFSLSRFLVVVAAALLVVAAAFAGRAAWNRWRGQAAGTFTWTPIGNMDVGTANLISVVYGNGRFVAVGRDGKGTYSDDGLTWTSVSDMKFAGGPIYSVTFGNGTFVAVGESGKGAWSADGATWTAVSDMKVGLHSLYAVIYGNGIFVAVDGYGSSSWSNDGITWIAGETIFSTGNSYATGIAYGMGGFMAINQNGYTAFSLDGITWRSAGKVSFGGSAIAFGNGKFVAVGGQGHVALSVDSNGWNSIGQRAGAQTLYGITYGNGMFLAVGGTLDGTGNTRPGSRSFWSTDGIAWTDIDSAGFVPIAGRSAAYGSGKFVAVGYNGGGSYNSTVAGGGASSAVSSSNPPVTWNIIWGMPSFATVTYGNGKFVGVGTSPSEFTWESADGMAWWMNENPDIPRVTIGTTVIVHGGGKFVKGGHNSKIQYSVDGRDWIPARPLYSEIGPVRHIAYGNGVFVAIGDQGCAYSSDADLWGPCSPRGVIEALTFGNGIFLAFGPYGNNYRSLDQGRTWTKFGEPLGFQGVRSAAYGNGRFVVVGGEGRGAYSTDGISWTAIADTTFMSNESIDGIVFGDGYFVARGGSKGAYSTDGITWTPIPDSIASNFYFDSSASLSFGAGKFFASNGSAFQWTGPGGSATILTSSAASSSFASSRSSSASSSRSSSVYSSSVSSAVELSPMTWTQVSVQDNATTLRAVAYGNGRFVAVGKERKGAYSDNGTAWAPVTTPYPFETIAFGNGRFVAGSFDGTAAYSVDGITWTAIAGMDRMGDIMFVNGRFFAARYNGAAATSADGITWSPLQVPVPLEDGVVYGNGKYVTVGSTNAGGIIKNGATSVDGIFWTAFNNRTFFDPSMPNATYFGTSSSIVFANGRFTAISTGGQIIHSTDGVTWTFDRNVVGISFLVFVGDRYIAVDRTGMGHYSGDGVGWIGTNMRIRARSVAYGNDRFVAVGENGYVSYSGPPVPGSSPSSTYSSSSRLSSVSSPASSAGAGAPSPFTWVPIPQMPSFTTMAYGKGTYVGVEQSGSSGWYSRDGVTWTEVPRLLGPVEKNVTTVAFGNGVFVAGGYDSRLSYSTDGVTWTYVNMPPNQQVDLMVIESIAFGNGQFVALGGGSAAVSTDGRTWQQASGAPLGGLDDALAYGNGRWVRVGVFGHGAVSQDGRTWTRIADMKLGQLADLKSVAFGNGTFVAVGQRGWGTVSTDGGVSWTKIPDTTFGQNELIQSVAFGGGYFVAAGGANRGAYSADGITWTAITDLALDRWSGAQHIMFDGQRFIAASQGKGSYAGPPFSPASSAASQLSSAAPVGICGNFVREAGEGCEVGVACPDGTGCNVETCACEEEARLQRAQSLCGNNRLDAGEDCESGMPLLYEPCKDGFSCNVQTCRCPANKSRFLRGRTKR